MVDKASEHDRKGIAAEYALGTLDPGEKRDAERLYRADSSFRKKVWQWHNKLSPLLEIMRPVSPPPSAFEDIMLKIGERKPVALSQVVSEVDVLAQSVMFWRRIALALGITVLLLISLFIAGEATRPVASESFYAVFETKERRPVFVAYVDLKKKTLNVVRLAGPSHQGKRYELWVPTGVLGATNSLGDLYEGRKVDLSRVGRFTERELMRTLFVISEEPTQRTSKDRPSLVLYTGKLVKLD